LALLVTRVLTDHAHHTLAADHFALVANLLDARSDLHGYDSWLRDALTGSLGDAAPVGVMGRDLEDHSVADDEPADDVAESLAEAGDYDLPALEFHSIQSFRKHFDDLAGHAVGRLVVHSSSSL